MTTFSKIHLSRLVFPADAPRWQFLTPYELKQVIYKAIGEDKGRFLFRMDNLNRNGKRIHHVLLQSNWKPGSLFADDPMISVETKEMHLGGLDSSRILRFFVRVNATRVYTHSVTKKKYRLPVGAYPGWQAQLEGIPRGEIPDRETQIVEWLVRQGEKHGFVLLNASVEGLGRMVFRKTGEVNRKAPPITVDTADIGGKLKIMNSEAFQNCVLSGIGKARSFGCGLVSLAPT